MVSNPQNQGQGTRMFDPNFTEADAAPILHHQTDLSRKSFDAAFESYPATDGPFNAWLNTQRAILHANPQHIHDPFFTESIQNFALALSVNGQHDAAMAWGRVAYAVSRRFAHGWLNFLDIVLAAGVFHEKTVRPQRGHSLVGTGVSIPNRILQFWDKPSPPVDVARLMSTWRDGHRGWFYNLLDESRSKNFIETYFGPRILSAFNSLSHVSSKSDLIRFCWILQKGGVYVDADENCTGSLDQILSQDTQFFLTWSPGRPPCVNTWFIGAQPGNSFIEKSILMSVYHIEHSKNVNLRLNAWILTGPGVFSMVLLDDIVLNTNSSWKNSLILMAESEYRLIVKSEESLAYRNSPISNWRLEKLS